MKVIVKFDTKSKNNIIYLQYWGKILLNSCKNR